MNYDYEVKMTTKSDIYEKYQTTIRFTAKDMTEEAAFTKAVAEAKQGAFFYYCKNMWNLDEVVKTEVLRS